MRIDELTPGQVREVLTGGRRWRLREHAHIQISTVALLNG